VAKKRISPEFRARFSEKLMDLGNLVVIALAIGPFTGGQEFSLQIFFMGIGLTLLCYIASYIISS
jgi:hypothetical protein